jgi:Spy/CpxP family protein refolding chaperone
MVAMSAPSDDEEKNTMFGFIFGTLCLIGLVKVVKGGRRWGWGGGYGNGPRRWMLRRLFERLDTTPGQEKVISEAFDEVQQKVRAVREELFRSRSQFAKAVRGEHFDTEGVRDTFEAQQKAVEELKKVALAGLQKIHEALTPEQRGVAAELIEFGPRGYGGCHGRFGHGHGYGRHTAVNL